MNNNPHQVWLVAEVGQAHEGSLGIAHSYIDALAGTGVDAVKFQVHIAEAESSAQEQFRVKFSKEDATRYDYWKRMQFTPKQWAGLKKNCEDRNLEFIASPFSIAAVDLLEEIGVKRYKVGSGEVMNDLLIDRIASTGKEVVLSSGMSSLAELNGAVERLKKAGSPIAVLQCTTAYPTMPEQWGLNVMDQLRNEFSCRVGFSDHSGDIIACLAAAALGADVLEFHVVFDRRMFGPDASSSLTVEEIRLLAKGVRQIEKAISHPVDKNKTSHFLDLKTMFGKSLAVNKEMKKGQKVRLEDLESKKPAGQGIAASEYHAVIGKMIGKDIARFSFLQKEDLID